MIDFNERLAMFAAERHPAVDALEGEGAEHHVDPRLAHRARVRTRWRKGAKGPYVRVVGHGESIARGTDSDLWREPAAGLRQRAEGNGYQMSAPA